MLLNQAKEVFSTFDRGKFEAIGAWETDKGAMSLMMAEDI
jgi:hypothetical protein